MVTNTNNQTGCRSLKSLQAIDISLAKALHGHAFEANSGTVTYADEVVQCLKKDRRETMTEPLLEPQLGKRLKAGTQVEAILVIFGRRDLIFYVRKLLENIKMTPLLCACAVVIILETQNCRKKAPCSVEFIIFVICDRQNWFSRLAPPLQHQRTLFNCGDANSQIGQGRGGGGENPSNSMMALRRGRRVLRRMWCR